MKTPPKRPSTGLIRAYLYEAFGALVLMLTFVALGAVAVGLHGSVTLP